MQLRLPNLPPFVEDTARTAYQAAMRIRHRAVSRILHLDAVEQRFEHHITHCVRPRWEALGAVRHSHFFSLNEFVHSPTLRPGAISIAHNGLPLDMSLRIKQGAPLLVVLHGAASEDVHLPFLSGQSVSKNLAVSKLSLSDPSLYLNPGLNLSWFAGNTHQPRLHDDLTRVITKVAHHCGAPRIILLGGSGGGFAAISLAARLEHATAVAMNPQTDIFRYHHNHVNAYIDMAWGGDRELFISQGVHNLSRTLLKSTARPQILYMQNSNDDFHVAHHLQRFIKEIGDYPFSLLQKPWRDGHTPPPKPLISRVLALLAANQYAQLAALGFVHHGSAAGDAVGSSGQ